MLIGIMTIYGGSNLGNKLQNYALQQYLINSGMDAETIRYRVRFRTEKKGFLQKMKAVGCKYFCGKPTDVIYNLGLLFRYTLHRSGIASKKSKREQDFDAFERANIRLSSRIFQTAGELKAANDLYDYIIAGSDQIWNPYWQGQFDEFFLTFADMDKRIAYAPSIGVSAIPAGQTARYRTLLHGFRRLSCREKQGCALISELSGKECAHVCDPVFLIGPDQWRRLAGKREKCVVTYFLGGKDSGTDKYIKSYARARHLRIIDLWSEKDPEASFCGVTEALSLIADAEILFTDSFHGCAMAINFRTPFVVCERIMANASQRMSSRIESLLERLNIQDRYLPEFIADPKDIDYDKVHSLLSEWREESRRYIGDCLNGQNATQKGEQ